MHWSSPRISFTTLCRAKGKQPRHPCGAGEEKALTQEQLVPDLCGTQPPAARNQTPPRPPHHGGEAEGEPHGWQRGRAGVWGRRGSP